MTTTVKFLHSELPGAPVLPGVAGSLIAVLNACLETGWGLLTAQSASVAGGVCTLNFSTSHAFEPDIVALVAGAGTSAINGEQRITATGSNLVRFAAPGVADGPIGGTITIKIAPAGWAKVFSGTNKAAYRSLSPSATGAYLRIDHTSAQVARMRGYASMTDVDTGTDPTPSDAQVAGGLYVPVSNAASAAARRWMIVASDKFVHILIAHHDSYQTDYGLCSAGDFPSLKAGDAYRFLVAGEVANNSSGGSPGTYNSLHNYAGSVGTYVMRPYSQVGGSVPVYVYKPGFTLQAWSGHGNHPVGPNPINSGIDLCPTLFLEGVNLAGNRRGEVPGLYGIPHFLGAAFETRDRIPAAVGLPGHTLIAVRYFGTISPTLSYRAAIDITGPWE